MPAKVYLILISEIIHKMKYHLNSGSHVFCWITMSKKAIASVVADEGVQKWKEELEIAHAYLCNMLMIRKINVNDHTSRKKPDKKRKGNEKLSSNDVLNEKYREKMNEFKEKRKFSSKNKKANKTLNGSVGKIKGKQNVRQKQNKRPKGPVSDESEETKKMPVNFSGDLSEYKGKKKSLEKQLLEAEKHEQKVKKARETEGPDAAVDLHFGKQFELAKAKAEGFKPRDDPEKLKNSIKRRDAKRRKSKNAWNQRVQNVQSQKAERQEKRKSNVKKKIDQKKQKKISLMKKKGRVL